MTITLTREEAQQVLDALCTWELMQAQTTACAVRIPAIETLRARLKQPEPEPVAKMREMLEVQGRDGTWDYEPYFHGMYNGMEFMLALAEGRDPVFRKAPKKWLNAPPQRVYCSCGDGIVANDGALCGTCVSLKDTVKQEPVAWMVVTQDGETIHLSTQKKASDRWRKHDPTRRVIPLYAGAA